MGRSGGGGASGPLPAPGWPDGASGLCLVNVASTSSALATCRTVVLADCPQNDPLSMSGNAAKRPDSAAKAVTSAPSPAQCERAMVAGLDPVQRRVSQVAQQLVMIEQPMDQSADRPLPLILLRDGVGRVLCE